MVSLMLNFVRGLSMMRISATVRELYVFQLYSSYEKFIPMQVLKLSLNNSTEILSDALSLSKKMSFVLMRKPHAARAPVMVQAVICFKISI